MTVRAWLLAGIAALGMGGAARADQACFATLARTRNFSLGQPGHAVPMPDGRDVLFLRSGPEDTALGLYDFDVASGTTRALALPGGSQTLSVEEKALRERERMTLSGITDFSVSLDGRAVLMAEAGRLSVMAGAGGKVRALPGDGWISPQLAPDGRAVAAVRDNTLHVVELAGMHDHAVSPRGSDTLSYGLAEFAAAEELERDRGTWWSPDSRYLVYERADTSGVLPHYIADPGNPAVKPVEFRYPKAGTPNAKVDLFVVPRDGGRAVQLRWDATALPYLVRVVWQKGGKLTLVLQNREETREVVAVADPKTGVVRPVLTETDPAWINISPEAYLRGAKPLPYWLPDGSGFLWAAERGQYWRLELHAPDGQLIRTLSPPALPFAGLVGVDMARGRVLFAARGTRLDIGVYAVPLAGGTATPFAAAPGLHDVRVTADGGLAVDARNLADGSAGVAVLDADGRTRAMLPSVAETPKAVPNVQYLTAGSEDFDAMVVRPQDFVAGRKYPVILSVYAGPAFKTVMRAPRMYLGNQCMADQGYIVVSLDGRGTPGRTHDFERATKYDLIDLPLADQVDGLQALGRKFPEMDMSRVGVTGWSFGGYFTVMAASRRGDVFRAGVAGAPPVDFADYDTAYTERYLGLPQAHADAYAKSNVLSYADKLSIPLLIMHGLTDDNVYFVNTVKLTEALTRAGKTYDLMLLPGTHLLEDPVLAERVTQRRMAYFARYLGQGPEK